MNLWAKEELAMILPIPVAAGSGENAVTFINLNVFPRIFDYLDRGYPVTYKHDPSTAPFSAGPVKSPIKVQSVGSFDASYVPSIQDFSRLDKRFSLPDNIWSKLPGYKDFGFAVFKFKVSAASVHPMAFSFPTAMPNELFFPTLHIHDGEIHAKEAFDHTLYCQGSSISAENWQESAGIASQFLNCDRTQGLILPNQHVYRRKMHGSFDNGDVLLTASEAKE